MDKAFAKLADTLMEGEGPIHQGCDCRPFALFSRRQVFGITNSRVIVLEQGLLGGFTGRRMCKLTSLIKQIKSDKSKPFPETMHRFILLIGALLFSIASSSSQTFKEITDRARFQKKQITPVMQWLFIFQRLHLFVSLQGRAGKQRNTRGIKPKTKSSWQDRT